MIYLSSFMMSLIVTIALMPILIKMAWRFHVVDMPDTRKVHETPIPRCGGIAIAIGACIPVIMWRSVIGFVPAYLAGAAVLVLIGLVDDYRGVDYRLKFTGQILAAAIVICYGGIRIESLGAFMPGDRVLPGWVSIPLTILAIVAVTNAVNLSDGLDGLAGGLSMLSLCCIGYLAYQVDNVMVVVFSLSLAGAIFGFLRFNTFPATLFMGDTGSMFLGFSLGALSLVLTQGSTPFSPCLPLVIVGLPLMDMAAVMCERLATGRSPFMADKNHFHHKLLRMGLFHSESVMVIYALQGILIGTAIFFRFYEDGILLTIYAFFFCMVLTIFFVADRDHWRFPRSSFLDKVVKGRLRKLKEGGFFIKLCFKGLENGLPLILIITCFVPKSYPPYLTIAATVMAVILMIVWIFHKFWLQNYVILSLYLLIPFIEYAATNTMSSWIETSFMGNIYYGAYIVLAVLVVATLKLTKRRQGFKVSPSDFLIIFIALLAPLIAGTWLRETELAEMVVKTILLYFSYEVLIGELRGKIGWLTLSTGAALVVVAIRG